jgi:LysM repeat protein
MHRKWWLLVAILLVLLGSGGVTLHAAPLAQGAIHIVQPGESWEEIAWRYATPLDLLFESNGVVNPALLAPGQPIFIPAPGSNPISMVPYVMGPNPSIYELAAIARVPTIMILLASGLSRPFAVPGQVVYVPDVQEIAMIPTVLPPTATIPAPTETPSPMPPTASQPSTAITVEVPEGALRRSLLGIQGHFLIPEAARDRLLDMVAYDLEFGWVKVQVDWSLIEYAPGQYSSILDELDLFMDDALHRGLHVLLSVVKAPDWARPTTEEDGPPANYEDYYHFLTFLVLRYKYRIQAIEIWNEPNLRREWNGAPLSGAEYVSFLAGAAEAVHREGEGIRVISAGLAPTGINDGVTAVDDRVFLQQMYEAGLANYVDGVGIHPYGWANPPWAQCCGDSGGVPSYNDHPSFFFLNTVQDYRAIQLANGDTDHQLWATEFGWGSVDGLDIPVPENAPYFAYTDNREQGDYILEAFRMGQGCHGADVLVEFERCHAGRLRTQPGGIQHPLWQFPASPGLRGPAGCPCSG